MLGLCFVILFFPLILVILNEVISGEKKNEVHKRHVDVIFTYPHCLLKIVFGLRKSKKKLLKLITKIPEYHLNETRAQLVSQLAHVVINLIKFFFCLSEEIIDFSCFVHHVEIQLLTKN